MAKKTTPESLRKQAQIMLERAKKLEHDQNAKVGEYLRTLAVEGFKDCNYDTLKIKIYEMFGIPTDLSTGNQKITSFNDKDISNNA